MACFFHTQTGIRGEKAIPLHCWKMVKMVDFVQIFQIFP